MSEKSSIRFIGAGGRFTATLDQDLDQFRYRNYRLTTFKANIKGKHLMKLYNDPANHFLISHPKIRGVNLDPEKTYTIAAPESILWSAKTIRNVWTDMIAGPDMLKLDIIDGLFGIDQYGLLEFLPFAGGLLEIRN